MRQDLPREESTIGAVCAVGGAFILLIGTVLHPMAADPNDHFAAFSEYAADRGWVASHLLQLAGIASMLAALLLLGRQLQSGRGATWARLGSGAAISSLALAAALQAVDGVALKAMVDQWAAAPAGQQAELFPAVVAVRQIEIGLASLLGLLLGTTITLYGLALIRCTSYPAWLGVVAIVAGVPTVVAGLIVAHTGFSPLAMQFNMPANALTMVWMVLIGSAMWRRRQRRPRPERAA